MPNITYSLKNKNWVELYKESNIPSDFVELCDNNKVISQILYTQGVTSPQELKYHLKKYKDNTELTSGDELPHIKQAINRISEAIDNKQNICIFGDYDVDGTTSTALLIRVFKILGVECDYYIPDRFSEGYGLNSKAVLKIKSQKKANLLITCDCGITNTEEIKLANTFGLDVIVTDHHSLPDELPPAIAVINPKILANTHAHYWLPGVGVAFKLAEILLNKYKKQKYIKELLDLVALGMIADLAPLRGENRLLTQQGLKILANTNKTGLKALLRECGYDQDNKNKSTDEENVGFQLAPRINAAGRLADAKDAVELFITEDELVAQQIVDKLSQQNTERQELCKNIYSQAVEYIDQNINIQESNVLFVSKQGWHHGVIGIVASKLVERYHLPVFIASEEDGKIKGSARSIQGINLHEQMTLCDELFSKYGGHKMAAGFSMTLENWDKFKTKLPEILAKSTDEKDYQANLNINLEFAPEEINIPTVNNILELAPFGLDFPKPIIKLNKKVKLTKIIPLGKDRKHLKLFFGNLEALLWNTTLESIPYIQTGQEFDLVFSVGLNNFQGRTSVQLDIKDWQVIAEKQTPTLSTEPSQPVQEEQQINNNNFIQAKETIRKIWSLIKEQKKEVLAFNKQKLTNYLDINEQACEESLIALESTECLKFKIEEHLYKVKITGNKPQKVKVSLQKLENILSK